MRNTSKKPLLRLALVWVLIAALCVPSLAFAQSETPETIVTVGDPAAAPRAEDVVSLRMEPGDLVVLKRGIWHDACHAVEGSAMYYFLSYSSPEPGETAWIPVTPAPVRVQL